jgi:hypothetical protein
MFCHVLAHIFIYVSSSRSIWTTLGYSKTMIGAAVGGVGDRGDWLVFYTVPLAAAVEPDRPGWCWRAVLQPPCCAWASRPAGASVLVTVAAGADDCTPSRLRRTTRCASRCISHHFPLQLRGPRAGAVHRHRPTAFRACWGGLQAAVLSSKYGACQAVFWCFTVATSSDSGRLRVQGLGLAASRQQVSATGLKPVTSAMASNTSAPPAPDAGAQRLAQHQVAPGHAEHAES